MPYTAKRDSRCPSSRPWGVVGGATGNKLFGCHSSKTSAAKQIGAIESNTSEKGVGMTQNLFLETLRTQLQTVISHVTGGDHKTKTDMSTKDLDLDTSPQDGGSFMSFKDATGSWRWVAIFSNNFRDDDKPVRQIVSSQAHQNYVKAVEDGKWFYPRLWLWHTPWSSAGKADMLHYDKETGMALASGTYYPGKEHIAQGLAVWGPLRVSHGMFTPSLVFDKEDDSVIVDYRSLEISPLPVGAQANRFTGFTQLNLDKEVNVALTEQKAAFLKGVGMTDQDITDINSAMDFMSQQAKEAGIQSKENGDGTEAAPETDGAEAQDALIDQIQNQQDDAPPATTETVEKGSGGGGGGGGAGAGASDDDDEDEEGGGGGTSTKEYTVEDVLVAVKSLDDAIQVIAEGLANTIAEVQQLKEMGAQVDEATEQALHTQTLLKELTPAASQLQSFVIGKEETRVDGRTVMAKDGPVETSPATQPDPDATGISFLDGIRSHNKQVQAERSNWGRPAIPGAAQRTFPVPDNGAGQ